MQNQRSATDLSGPHPWDSQPHAARANRWTRPLGTAYAAWTGVGTVGTAALGVVLSREPAPAGRLPCTALIAAGLVSLVLAAPLAH